MIRRSEGWAVRPVPHAVASEFVRAHHYSKGCANTSVSRCGLFNPSGDLVGVSVWMPPAPGVVRLFGPGCISLSRMAIHDDVPKNAASFLLSRSYTALRQKGYHTAVAYSDLTEGHTGHVYKASGWTLHGMSRPRPRWVDQSGRMRSLKATTNIPTAEAKRRGWRRVAAKGKSRWVFGLSKAGRRAIGVWGLLSALSSLSDPPGGRLPKQNAP